AAGALACVTTRDSALSPAPWSARAEQAWGPSGDALACLSVRTGFDLLLQALQLPPGSEVLLSAITIADMARIIQAHGLVPVPVDLDPETLQVCSARLETLLSPRTRML